jgi:tetratricopeptide (TPR) repeat protein
MPYVINGVGTWYYGRTNVSRRHGQCPNCGAETILTSYDTTSYFTVAFVPLIPLGRRHITDQCPHCKKHFSVPLQKWQQERQREIDHVLIEYKNNPGNRETTLKLLRVLFDWGREDLFLELAPDVISRHGGNPEIMSIVAAIYSGLGRLKEAEDVCRRALNQKFSFDLSIALAQVLIKQLRPDEAYEYLRPVIDERRKEDVAQLLFLAEGYQAAGDHAKALEVLDSALDIQPALERDKYFRKMRGRALKNQFVHKPIKSKTIELAGAIGKTTTESDWSGKAAKLALPYWLPLLSPHICSSLSGQQSHPTCI